MRRLTAMLMVLTLLFTTAALAEAPQPNPSGMWATSTEETLCGMQLILKPDNTFIQIGEGLLTTGKWRLDGHTLTLYEAVSLQTGVTGVPQPVSYTLDASCTVLEIGGGLHLYRAVPSTEGVWYYALGAGSGFAALLLSENACALTYTVPSGEQIPPLPEGGCWFEGTWWLEGTWTQEDNILTITAENGCVYTFTQDLTSGFLHSQEGYAFYTFTTLN